MEELRDYQLLKFLLTQNRFDLFNKNPFLVALENDDNELFNFLFNTDAYRNDYSDNKLLGYESIKRENIEIFKLLFRDPIKFGCCRKECGTLILQKSLVEFCDLYTSILDDDSYSQFILDCILSNNSIILNAIRIEHNVQLSQYHLSRVIKLDYPNIIELLLDKIDNYEIRKIILDKICADGNPHFVSKIIRERNIYSEKSLKICIGRKLVDAVKEFIMYGKYFEYEKFENSMLAYSFHTKDFEIFNIFLDLWIYSMDLEEWFIKEINNMDKKYFIKIFSKFTREFNNPEIIIMKALIRDNIPDGFFDHVKNFKDKDGNNILMIFSKISNYGYFNDTTMIFLNQAIDYCDPKYTNNKGENIFDIIAMHKNIKQFSRVMIERGFVNEMFSHPNIRSRIMSFFR